MSFRPQYDSNGNPVVQHEFVEDFPLVSGAVVPSVRLGYCVYGDNPDNPVIVLHPALTGSPVASCPGKRTQGPGWWTLVVGPGLFLDTNRFTVVCVDFLGGNGDSSSAEELREYRERICFADGVRLTAEILERHGVQKLHAVVGGSVGGGQALEWLFQDRIDVERIFDISGSYFRNGKVSEFFSLQAELLWGQGRNIQQIIDRAQKNVEDLRGSTEAFDLVREMVIDALARLQKDYSQREALQVARQFGFLRFVTPRFFQVRWERYLKEEGSREGALRRLQSWLEHQGRVFPERFSADALAQLCAMDARSKNKPPEDIAKRLHSCDTNLIGFAVIGDVLFDADLQEKFYAAVQSHLPPFEQGRISIDVIKDEENGHDHFLTEKFLESVPALAERL